VNRGRTIQTFLGDIMDWLDPASVEGSQEEPPPKPSPEELLPAEGLALQLTELDMFPELRGPAGTIPVLRPSFIAYVSGLTGATSLDDFLTNYLVPGVPGGPGRLYAGIASLTPNLGASSWINSFGGEIELGTMSVLEMVVGCPMNGEMWQQIGIAASKDWANNGLPNFGDLVLRVQVEFLTAGSSQEALGDGKGGWDGASAGFVHAEGAPYPPGVAIVNPSRINEDQFESLYNIRFSKGNWWVGWNGNWLGYYPGKLFGEGASNLLASQACEVAWYGEVYDPNSTPTKWTFTDMGSGQFASEGWKKAAIFRNPTYVDPSEISQWPDAAPPDANPHNDACYTKSGLGSGPTPWDRFFYVGGPGGDAPNVGCPVPHQD
jgi:hypothetical protein